MLDPVYIGITTSLNEEEQRLRLDYVRAVEQAGAVPLIVPMLTTEAASQAVAELLHGLVITGGPAVTVGLIGTLPDDIDETDPVRMQSDRWMLRAMQAAGKPVFGICYGMQLMNAEAGGTLYADVEHQLDGAAVHSHKRGGHTHAVQLAPGSLMHRLLGTNTASVNTRHVQAVASLGDGFRITGRSPDGVVEAIEHADGLAWGVQFHPERMDRSMQPLFEHLVVRARALDPHPVTD